jgi:Fe-coproporphyrin III synthase
MRPRLRIRRERFGFTLADAVTGDVGFYGDGVAAALLEGARYEDLAEHRLASVPLEQNFRLVAPLIVWFEITRACNLPCRHCYISAGPRRENELSKDEILDVLQQLRAAGVFALVLVGGEPMAHPHFLEILHAAHDLGFVISIATNGTYLTQEIIDQIPREECIVSVSLDGTSFQKRLRLMSTYEDIRSRLELLVDNGVKAAVMTTVTQYNLAELEEIFEFTQEKGLVFGLAPFSPLGRGRRHADLLPDPSVAAQASRLYARNAADRQQKYPTLGLCVTRFLNFSYQLAHAMRREFCAVSLAYITSNGKVYPCSVCASAEKFPGGDLREHRFLEIWDGEFDGIRKIGFDSFKGCKTCDLSAPEAACAGRCPVMSEVYTGDPLLCGASPYLREANRQNRAWKAEATGGSEGE